MPPLIDVRHLYPLQNVWWRAARLRTQLRYVSIHHTVTFYLSPTATQQDELNQLALIHQYHLSIGYGGIGYHIVSFPSGRRYLVSSLDRMGASVSGKNDIQVAVALAGDFTARVPGVPQFDACAAGIVDCWKYREAA